MTPTSHPERAESETRTQQAPSDKSNDLRPRSQIRRFDVFAEFNRIKNEQKGMPADRAKGDAIWLAKVVAARKFARTPETRDRVTHVLGKVHEPPNEESFKSLEGVEQTGELFDREIVRRMGDDFYRQVFSPAIAQAIDDRKSYESIRDRIRTAWKPE